MEVLGLEMAPLSWVQLVSKPLSWLTHYCEDKKQLCGPLGPQVVAYKMTVARAERRKASDRLLTLDMSGGILGRGSPASGGF